MKNIEIITKTDGTSADTPNFINFGVIRVIDIPRQLIDRDDDPSIFINMDNWNPRGYDTSYHYFRVVAHIDGDRFNVDCADLPNYKATGETFAEMLSNLIKKLAKVNFQIDWVQLPDEYVDGLQLFIDEEYKYFNELNIEAK